MVDNIYLELKKKIMSVQISKSSMIFPTLLPISVWSINFVRVKRVEMMTPIYPPALNKMNDFVLRC